MEAVDEPQQKPSLTTVTAKTPAPAQKKVEKKAEKKKPNESHEFVIETTTATPQLMKSLIGDSSNIIPDFEDKPEEPVKEAPKP